VGLGAQAGMTPRVSVVVPVRDRRLLLRQLLDGLAAQSFRDFEVLVVDDHSTDDPAAEAAAGGNVRVVPSEGDGAVAARRTGIRGAVGEILAFTDSDCVPTPGWLAAGVAAIDAGADVVQGLTRPRRAMRPLERSVVADRADGLFATCNVFYRRDAFDDAGGFDDASHLGFRAAVRARRLGFGEDTITAWRVARCGRSAFAPGAVVEHEVLPPDLTDALARAWLTGAFPALVAEVPELRDQLLVHRVFLGTSRAALYGGLALGAVGKRRAAALAFGVWAAGWVRDAWRHDGPPARRLAAVPALLALDAITGVAVVAGSVRARTVVL
jgi:hypothetical protein